MLRKSRQWYYVKYDAKGRTIATGIYLDNASGHRSRTGMQNYVNSLTAYATTWYEKRSITSGQNRYYYTSNVFPTTNLTGLAYNYYDNYDLDDNAVNNFAYITQGLPHEATQATQPIKGLPTMFVKRSMGPGFTSDKWILSASFYDTYGHVIQTRSNNQLNYTQDTLTDTKTTVPDFTGRPLYSQVVKVTGTSATNTIQTIFKYDANHIHLTEIDQKYNSGSQIRIATYTYNEINQLVSKSLGYNGSKYLQNPSYRYNIRGQLTSINNSKLVADGGKTCLDNVEVFGMIILYDQADSKLSNDVPSYSGRISAVKWMARNSGNTKKPERSYVYAYDKLDRYVNSGYAERAVTDTGNYSNFVGAYNEGGISYDENGNIITLHRKSLVGSTITNVDALGYTYNATNPNQLDAVKDTTGNNTGFNNATGSTGNYSYDTSTGNLTTDPYKGLTLKYNFINRVDTVLTTSSALHKGYISYTYDATGNMMRKQIWIDSVHLQSTNDYIDGMVYTDSTLSYLPMPEGRVIDSAGVFMPEYVLNDQQGNARYAFRVSSTGTVRIMQENSYYAFGEALANYPVTPPALPNNNLYNGGAERQTQFSNLLDFDQTLYRNYDPAIGRFMASDPMAESAESMTTYQYAMDNPVMMNDPMGNLVGNGGNLYGTNRPASGFSLPANQGISSGDAWAMSHQFGVSDIFGTPNGYGGYNLSSGGGGPSGPALGSQSNGSFWNIARTVAAAISNALEGTDYNGVHYEGNFFVSMTNAILNTQVGQVTYLVGFRDGSVMQRTQNISTNNTDNAIVGLGQVAGKITRGGANGYPLYGLNILSYGINNCGLFINLAFQDDNSGLTNFDYIQTIRTNVPLGNAQSPYNDPQPPDDNLPFYWTNAELPNYTNKFGFNVLFQDGPERSMKNGTYWQAELSVVGMDSSGHYVPISTITYGFQISNNDITVFPILEVNPSTSQLKSIP